jgi:ferrochelatase
VRDLKEWKPERIVLLPLYPQFSTTTTASSLEEWMLEAKKAGLSAPTAALCCYPHEKGFVAAYADLLKAALKDLPAGATPRIVFSAHGLPEKIVKAGDPYPMQVEAGAKAIAAAAGVSGMDTIVTYQSRVGPLKWIGPDTDDVTLETAKAGKVPVVVPLAFVSEHSETLYELDQVYRDMALKAGAPAYIRVAAVGTHFAFIEGLGDLVRAALTREGLAADQSWGGCGAAKACPCRVRAAA